MEKWIGNRPTLGQKALNKYNKLLDNTQYTLIPNEIVLKIVEAECDKSSGRELNGVLVLTNMSVHFISKKEHFHYEYSQINDINVETDGKDKNEWKLVLRCGWSNRYFDDIKKNDDSQEFIEILEYKIVNPTKDILTTVTHDFTYFLHAKRLEELRNKNVKITSFLMKRDNMGFSKNGERLLREKHNNAKLITEGLFKENKEKKGNFIVIDNNIFLYEYNDKKREVKLIYSWAFLFLSHSKIDHFAMKSEVEIEEGTLVLNSSGKAFASILIDEGVEFELKKRKWHQKILGFRSGKWWKKATASIFYLFTILLVFILVFVEETEEPITTSPETEAVTESEVQKSEEAERLAEEQRQKEEAERIAEEQRQKEEAERLAEEQRQKEEAERLAEEQRQKEEAERLAEEQRQKEEAERLAEEQRQAEQQTNVYFKNCDAARSAGAAPVHQGEPGYGKHLDRDGDGIGCDR